MSEKIKRVIVNIVSGFGGQLLVIVFGIIMPRFFIVSFGSDVNGLLNTITQVFTYVALLEAGIGQAAKNLLYEPFCKKDREKVNQLANMARNYYRKITFAYAILVILLAMVCPYVIKSSVDKGVISILVLLEGFSGVISFCYNATSSIIIEADGNSFICNCINSVCKILTYIFKIIIAVCGCNIVLLQVSGVAITIIKAFVFKLYFNKKYEWISWKKVKGKVNLQDRYSYLIVEICWTIFSSTDLCVLSVFVSTKTASVYGIYNMVFASISLLLGAVYSSVNYLLGQTFHKSKDKYVILHDAYNSIFLGLMTAAMICCYILIVPFVSLYTKGISDINYVDSSLPILFCIIQLLSWARYISGNLVGVAGRIRKAVWVNIVEAVTNLFLSILLVSKYEIKGVLLATVVALPLKMIYCNFIADKYILKRKLWNSLKIIGANFLLFSLCVVVNPAQYISIDSYLSLFICGIFTFIISFIIVAVVNVLINPNMKLVVINMIKRSKE